MQQEIAIRSQHASRQQNRSTANEDVPQKQNLSKMNGTFVLCDRHNPTGVQKSEIIITMTQQWIEFPQ